MKIAVTGPRGRLGSWLVETHGCEPMTCDITSVEEVEAEIARLEPHVIINCAAFTDVDGCEDPEHRERAIATNVRGPGVLRRAFGGFFIHLSTGYVFDGLSGPYDESAVPGPVSFYGMTKLGGEAAAALRSPTAIVRTLDLFGPRLVGRADFVRQVRDLIHLGLPFALPSDLYGSPTYIPHLAAALLEVARLGPRNIILNLTGTTVISRLEFGRMVARMVGADPELIMPGGVRGKARRPLRGGLNVSLALGMGLRLYTAEEGLAQLLEDEAAESL